MIGRPPGAAAALSPAGLVRRHLAGARPGMAALSVSVAAMIALAWLLPMMAVTALRSGFHETLSSGYLAIERPGVTDFDGFARFELDAASRVSGATGSFLGAGTALASAGPLYPATLDDQPVAGQVRGLQATVAYQDDLEAHVAVLAGELPPDGLGGDNVAVTIPQSGADQLGLRLSDRFCLDFVQPQADGPPDVCVRIVGLWRPLSATDPFWGGAPPRLQLTMGRFDFFQLLPLAPASGTLAVRRYVARNAVRRGDAVGMATRLRVLRDSLAGGPTTRLHTTLDAGLSRFDAAEESTLPTVQVLVAAVLVVALCLVALAAAWCLAALDREAGILRTRGTPAAWEWRALLAGLAAPPLLGTALGLLWAAAGTAALDPFTAPWPPVTAAEAMPAAVVVGAAAVCVALALAALAAEVAARPVTAAGAPTVAPPWWHRRNVDLPLAVAGFVLILLRPVRRDVLGSGDVGILALAPVVGVAVLAPVALRLLPVAARVAIGRRDVAAALASRQLARRACQHGRLALLLVAALMVAVFCAAGLAVEPASVSAVTAVQEGRQLVLEVGLLAVLAMAVAGFALHFGTVARVRCSEYAVLALNGLPAAAIRDSLGLEQMAVLAFGLVTGTVLGLALALLTLPAGVAQGRSSARWLALLGALVACAVLLVSLGLAAWMVRRLGVRGNLLRELGRPG